MVDVVLVLKDVVLVGCDDVGSAIERFEMRNPDVSILKTEKP